MFAEDDAAFLDQLEQDPVAMVGLSRDGVVLAQPLHGAKAVEALSAGVHKLALLAEPRCVSSSGAPSPLAWAKPMPLAAVNEAPPPPLGMGTLRRLAAPALSAPLLGEPNDLLARAASAAFKYDKLSMPTLASMPSIPIPALNGRITSEQWDVEALAADADLGMLTNEALDSLFVGQTSEAPVAVEMER